MTSHQSNYISRFSHKAPPLPPRSPRRPPTASSASTASSPPPPPCHYVLMHDKKGWMTALSRHGHGMRMDSDYLRTTVGASTPDVDVEKGTLVEQDPYCEFDPQTNISVNVVSVDRPEVKISLLMKELFIIEAPVFERLLPLRPAERYAVMTDDRRHPMLAAGVGDTVYCVTSSQFKEVAMIQYVGYVPNMGRGIFYGVELLDSDQGHSDGSYGGKRYFNASPGTAAFVTVAELYYYDERQPSRRPNSLVSFTQYGGDQPISSGESVGRLKIVEGRNRVPESDVMRYDEGRRKREDRQAFHSGGPNIRSSGPPGAPSHSSPILRIGDRVVWPSDYGPEFGYVRWLGHIDEEDEMHAGVEFMALEAGEGDPSAAGPAVDEEEVQMMYSSVTVEHRNNGFGHAPVQVPAQPVFPNGNDAGFVQDQGGGMGHPYPLAVIPLVVPQQLAAVPPAAFAPPPAAMCYNPYQGVFFQPAMTYPPTGYFGAEANGYCYDEETVLREEEKLHSPLSLQDNQVGVGGGSYKGRRLFQSKKGHASLVPLGGLIRADDYDDGQNSHQKERVKGRRSLRRSRGGRRATPHNDEEGDVDDEDWRAVVDSPPPPQRDSPPPPSYSTNTSSSASDDRALLLERRTLSDRATITSLKDKRRPPTPPRCSPSPPGSAGSGSSSSNNAARPVTVTIEPPSFDKLEPRITSSNHKNLEIGTLVELRQSGLPHYGVIKWIGYLEDHDRTGVGVELEEDMVGASNGWYRGTQRFACPDGRAVFAPFTHVKPDDRFNSNGGRRDDNGNEEDFGGMDCPSVAGFHSPIKVSSSEALSARVAGRNKGIQGHQNSCYLDATLFAMFSFTSVFDSLLYRQQSADDIDEYGQVQKVLREEIVNPLRKSIFVRADKVMKLRLLLDSLTSVKGLTTEEKDPEEFLNSLLTQTLKASPFLELSSGQTAHLYQLFVEKEEGVTMPTVQELFEQSFRTSEVKLRKVPSVLILQMPRFGRQYKVYDRIVPSQLLDITDVIEDSPRQCIICGKLATVECLDCFGAHGHGTGLDSTSFCRECIEPVHAHHKRRKHKTSAITVPEEFLAGFGGGGGSSFSADSASSSSSAPIPRLYMELFAVVCIETSHYVTFVKSGMGPDAPWCFFDSMADRKGEADGYNIPEVTPEADVPKWLSEEGAKALGGLSDKALPSHAKRLVCDGYMCFYQSPEVMMYQ